MEFKVIILLGVCAFTMKSVAAAINRTFPASFKFGVATASYQVEGAWNEDGKGENIWDHAFHADPHYAVDDNNGDIACDSYHKYKQDVAQLVALGVDYYRFSISWSRIIPGGVAGSAINQAGTDYYNNLLQELADNGIEPMVTMYHWDLPEQLQGLGGWPNEDLIDHFGYYARTLYQQFGDRVKHWMTFNEPKQTCLGGYGSTGMPPGYTLSGLADYKCAHTVIKAHAAAYRIYDDEFRSQQNGSVGIVIDTAWFEPESDSDGDIEASERSLHFNYGWYVNPIVYGNYPQIMIDRVGNRSQAQGYEISRLPLFTAEEQERIKGTYDFLAINFYSSVIVRQAQNEADVDDISISADMNVDQYVDPNWEQAASSWLYVTPWGIRNIVNWVSKTYDSETEIFITENGFSDNGSINDDRRINFYKEYLSSLLEAILDDGINVTRYTAWSLMDNLEWRQGFGEKFGLYQVDFTDPDRPRTRKASAAYYTQVITSRCLVDSCE